MGGMTVEEMAESSDGAIVREVQKIKEDVGIAVTAPQVNIESKLNDIYSYVYHIHNRLTRMETKLTAFLKGEKFEQKVAPRLPEFKEQVRETSVSMDRITRQPKEDDYWKSTN